MTAIVDIETPYIPDDGDVYSIDKIFCIGVKVDEEPTKLFTYLYHPLSSGNLKAALKLINSCSTAVFHNGIRFDIPVITSLLGPITAQVHDTLLLTKMMYTSDQLFAMDPGISTMPKSLYGSYSLAAFGHRLGLYKGEFEDFSKLSTQMLEYLAQDVAVTHKLYTHLIKQHNFPSSTTIDLENKVATHIFQQERNGFYFDIDKARALNTKLLFERGSIERKLQQTFKPMFLPDGTVKEASYTRKLYIPDKTYIPKW